MNHIIKASLVGIFFALVLFVLGTFVSIARANPSALNRAAACQTASATTSLVSMSAGNATTTITCDMQYATALVSDSAVLEVQRTASSTNSVTKIKFEYSMDRIDWYSDHLNMFATTSPVIGFPSSAFTSYTWQFASSTIGAASTSPAGSDAIVIPFSVPTRYVRVIMTVPAQASSSLLWAEITGKKENN
jgi:hypothetical protein